MSEYETFIQSQEAILTDTEYFTLYDFKQIRNDVTTQAHALQSQVEKRQLYMSYADVLGLKNNVAAAHDFYRLRYRYSEQKNQLRDFLDEYFKHFTQEFVTTASPRALEERAHELR